MPRQFGPTMRRPEWRAAAARHAVFELLAFAADLSKAGRDDEDAHDSQASAFIDQVGHGCRGGADDGQVGGVGQGGQALVGRDALHGLALRVDGIDDTAEAVADSFARGHGRPCREFAGTDDGNAVGAKDLVQIANRHETSSSFALHIEDGFRHAGSRRRPH